MKSKTIPFTESLSRVNSFALILRQLDTISPVFSYLYTQAVPSVMMTVSVCFQNSDTSVNFLLATSKKSCLFALANDVWWLNEHILPAPAPISIHSSSVNGTAEVILAIALQIETGL